MLGHRFWMSSPCWALECATFWLKAAKGACRHGAAGTSNQNPCASEPAARLFLQHHWTLKIVTVHVNECLKLMMKLPATLILPASNKTACPLASWRLAAALGGRVGVQ